MVLINASLDVAANNKFSEPRNGLFLLIIGLSPAGGTRLKAADNYNNHLPVQVLLLTALQPGFVHLFEILENP